MYELKTLFKGSLRPRTGYSNHTDPLVRWKTNIKNLAIRHRSAAADGQQAAKKPWHEQQIDGSYIATLRLNHALVEIDGQNCWAMADLDEVVKFYDVVISKLDTNEFDLDILKTASTIKSMKKEALSILNTRFPDSLEPEETAETINDQTVAEESQVTATNLEV